MSRGHKIVANFLKKRGAWDTPVTKVSSYVGADAAKPAEKKPKPKLDAKVLNSYVGKKMAEAAAPPPPFDKPYKKTSGTVTDKSGAKHSPMSQARDLARKGMKQMIQINPKIAEGWSHAALDQLTEVHPSIMAMAKVGANKTLKAQADKHTEMAIAANRAGDDEKVRHHQAQVAKIKAQMQTAQAEGYIDFTRPSGAAYDAKMVKGKMVIVPAKKKVTKLPMSQAAGAIAAEAVTYAGLGTDVVDKKKKLNPQPNLTMKPKQVKDFKEEVELDEGNRLSHALVQVGKSKWHIYDTKTKETHSTYNNKNVAMKKYGELNDKHAGYDSPGGLVHSKYGVRKEETITEGKMKEIYTDMQDHAAKKGYSSHKQFTPADYDAVGKQHGISGKELAVIAGHKTAAQVTKEETIAEGKVYGHEVDVKKYDSHLHGREGEYYDGVSDHEKDKEHLHHLMKKHGYKEDIHYTANDNAMHDDMLHDVNLKAPHHKEILKHHDIKHFLHHLEHDNADKVYNYKKGKLKEENLDELKASTMQSYADKAHQQAMDATYDAAHLNRSGEEKLKADAKKLAAKRAGGVQRAQTKMDKMSEEMTDQSPMQLAHGIGDVVQCTRTQRLASIISAEDDKYTVVYADGSTETGPADYWSAIRPVTEGRVIEQPRGWNVKHLKPAGHGIVGKKVRSYDFPGMHDSHYIEGHVTDEDPQSYHIRTTKVVRHHKEEPVSSHMMHIRAPKGMSLFGGAQGVYYAPKEMKPAAKKTMRGIRGK